MFLLNCSSRLNSRLGCLAFLKLLSPFTANGRRTLLSNNYSCENEWSKRLQEDDTLKHISTETYFFELNQKYQQKQAVSAVDIDIFVNSVYRPESQVELEHIVRRFRQTPKTVDTLESTHHAVCRFYLSHDKRDDLLNVLNNRVEFGIFPDQFIYNILMDDCIENEEWHNGFHVVKLMMLQEDAGNDISKTLAFYLMNKLLINGKVGPQEPIEEKQKSPEESPPDEDDIEYIRVPFLTNPFFDDHFDLVEQDHLFGKSLYFFGRELEKCSNNNEDAILANTAMIIGLIHFQRWPLLNNLIDRLSQKGKFLATSEPLAVIGKHLKMYKSDDSIEKELKPVESRLGELLMVVPQKTMSDLIDRRVQELPKLESLDIEQMCKMFVQFRDRRLTILDEQMGKLIRKQRNKEIQQKQKDFEQKKRLYYFFENFSKHEIDFVEAEKRIAEIQSKTVVEENYVPPEKY